MREIHGFNIELAIKYGLEESILINHFIFCTKQYKHNHNLAVEKGHFNDDKYWLCNSTVEWQKQYPYMTAAVIRRALIKLDFCGLIQTGNYNKTSYDRTKWYALTDRALKEFSSVEFRSLTQSPKFYGAI